MELYGVIKKRISCSHFSLKKGTKQKQQINFPSNTYRIKIRNNDCVKLTGDSNRIKNNTLSRWSSCNMKFKSASNNLCKPCLYDLLNALIIKVQNICNLIGWNSVHISDIFNCYRANIKGMWNTWKLVWPGYAKQNSYKPKPYIWRYRVNQHLIVLNLYSISIHKTLIMEFMTVRVSQNLNLM